MTTIVVGTDGSGGSVAALSWAVHQAQLTGTPVHLISAWTVPPVATFSLPPSTLDEFRQVAEASVERTMSAVPTLGVEVTGEVIEGPAADVLCQAVGPDDLLVVGTRGAGGFERLLLGSVTRAVLHHTHAPTVVVRAGMPFAQEGHDHTVVVGVDAATSSRRALVAAVEAARQRGAACIAVHACQLGIAAGSLVAAHAAAAMTEAAEQQLASRIDDVETEVKVEGRAVMGPPAATLLELSTGADLLVVGRRTHGWLGSVAVACAEHAACPVLVMPPG